MKLRTQCALLGVGSQTSFLISATVPKWWQVKNTTKSLAVGNQAQALPHSLPRAHLPRSQPIRRHALGSPQRLPRNRAPRDKEHLVPDPQRQKRQRHGVEVLSLHLGHLRSHEAVFVRCFALDRDVVPARRAADEISPCILYEALADLGRFQLVKRRQDSNRLEPL